MGKSKDSGGPLSTLLRVGSHEVAVDDARKLVRGYLNGEFGSYAYPSYDGFRTNDNPDELCDGDLLAPVLLNVKVKIRTFAYMRACSGKLDTELQAVPKDLELSRAEEADLRAVGRLFSILDSDARPKGTRGTTLSKILHRKRPLIVPLYDRNVRGIYMDGTDAPIGVDRRRSWEEFIYQLARAIRDDLNRAPHIWDELARLTPSDGPRISPLRALDILAWRLGTRATD